MPGRPPSGASDSVGRVSDESTLPTDAAPAPVGAAPSVDADPDVPAPTTDLERIERDLAGVEAALARLDDGTYWTDEVTGAEIPEGVLAADPVTRRAG